MIYLILGAIILGLGGYSFYLTTHRLEIKEVNEQNKMINDQLDRNIEQKQRQLDNINSLTVTAQEMRKSAKEQYDKELQAGQKEIDTKLAEYYQALSADYEKDVACYQAIIADYKKDIATIDEAKQQEENKLQELKNKQSAYIEAMQRQEEMDSKQDYYRLVISELDLNDITLLRELQKHLIKKDSVDKVIYETYYRPAYDLLMSHLFSSTAKVCGIYKITDLITGKSYIGQSVDIRERFRQHIKTSLAYGKATNKLYQAMQKSGQSNFTFEVLEQVPRDKLNEREIFWIDFYKTRETGLNSTRGGA